jgi:hypothetical protein
MSQSVLVLVFAGPLFAPALLSAGVPVNPVAAPARWTSVSLSAELRAKDTDRINLVTAGEDQKSSMSQCEAAEDADLCRLLIAVVNVAAVVGSVVTGP